MKKNVVKMRKGIVVGSMEPLLLLNNGFAPASVALDSDWASGVGANWDSDEMKLLPEGFKFVPMTAENLNPTWQRITTWANYEGYWQVGNEPRTDWDGNKSVAEVAPIFMNQMDLIKSFDPDAKFIVTCSTQGQTPYNRHNKDANFIGEIWNLFPPKYRNWTTGFHMHIYPRWISDDPAIRWDVRYFTRYVRGLKRWMTERGIPDKEIWITEFGFEGMFADDAAEYQHCVDYVRDVLKSDYLNRTVKRIAFYVATEREGAGGSNGYLPLLFPGGVRNALGEMWYGTKYP